MAHSHIYLDDLYESRSFASTDSIIHIFMFFFLRKLEDDLNDELPQLNMEMTNHYRDQLKAGNWAMIDLKIDYIYEEIYRMKWFLINLQKLDLKFQSFGEFIDHQYLNSCPLLNKKYSRAIPVGKLLNFNNNVRWVMRVEGVVPSKDFLHNHEIRLNKS